jgi:hypothetical protein
MWSASPEERPYVDQDMNGNMFLTKPFWDRHPHLLGLPYSEAEGKEFLEKLGCNPICSNCVVHENGCDHKPVCSFCERNGLVCTYAISKDPIRHCRYGNKCHDVHPETQECLRYIFKTEVKPWFFPQAPKLLGNGGLNHRGVPKQGNQLPEKGILKPYHEKYNPAGFKAEDGCPWDWIMKLFVEPMKVFEDCRNKAHLMGKWKERKDVAALPPAKPTKQEKQQKAVLKEVPAEFKEQFGNNVEEFKRQEADAYLQAIAQQENRYNILGSSECGMPGNQEVSIRRLPQS